MARRLKCPRCHYVTSELIPVKTIKRGNGAKVCKHCLKILRDDPNARIESHALAKYTRQGFIRGNQINSAVKVLGMVPLRKHSKISSKQCPGNFEEVVGDNLPWFFECIHDNWRVLMKIHAGNEAKHRELNRAMEIVKKWCSKRGLGR